MSDGLSRFQAFVEEVRQKTDLAALIASEGYKFESVGKALRCLSPIRKERTPSFFVYPDGGWHDFGTGESGDCFSYVQKRDGVEFKEAVAKLADRAGVTPYWKERQDDDTSPEHLAEIKNLIERRGVQERLTEAASYFHLCLPTKIRNEYYKKIYGFTDETIDRFKLGYADGSLSDHFLEELQYSKEACLRTGLFIRRQEELIDFFEARLVIPYWRGGNVVYFIGRRTEYSSNEEWEKGKYKKLLTSGDKHPYVSQSVSNEWFWNEDCCSKPIKWLIITEGVADCIALVQYGYNGMSPVTIRFRAKDNPKLVRLCKMAEVVFLCNDADVLEDGRKPGEEGALATAIVLFKAGIDVRLVTLPRPEGVQKIDVCEFLRDNGKEPFDKLLEAAPRYPEFLINRVPKELEPAELEKQLEPLFELIASCAPVAQERYIGVVAERFGLSKKTINKKLVAYGKKNEPIEEEPVSKRNSKESNGDGNGPRSSRASERVRGEVVDDAFFYYVKTPSGIEERVSSFTLSPLRRLIVDGIEHIQCDVECMSGKTYKEYTFPKKAWRSSRDFKDALPGPDAQWTGGDEHVQGVLNIITANEIPIQTTTSVIGFHNTENGSRWVWPGGVLSSDGIMDIPDIVYNGSVSIGSRIQYVLIGREELLELAGKTLPLLLKINIPEVILPIIAWFFSTPFRTEITRLRGHFPILMVWGTPGSGKTSLLCKIFWPLLGVISEPYRCTQTEYAQIRAFSGTNGVPVVFDEYKLDIPPRKLDVLHRLLRGVYGGETEERGRPDLTTVVYRVQTPIALGGEAMPIDTAIIERTICVNTNKNTLSKNEYTKAFEQLRTLPLYKMALPFIRWTLTQNAEEFMEKAVKVTAETIQRMKIEEPAPRIKDNLLIVTFGILVFNAWQQSLGLSVIPRPLDSTFRRMLETAFMDGPAPKDVFDRFLEQMSVYEHKGLLKEGVEYVVMSGGRLRLHLASCYELYLSEQRKSGREDETNGLRVLHRVAKEKSETDSYVLDASKRTDMRSATDGEERLQVRCVEIDQDKIPDWLEFKRFRSKVVRVSDQKPAYGSN